jgi:HAD superfamily hydrolase (TIGR01509 family)
MRSNIVVIFDLDGVVADTVEVLFEIYLEILEGFNVRGSRDEFAELNGLKIEEIAFLLVKRYALPVSGADLKESFLSEFRRIYKTAALMDGLLAAIESLRRAEVRLALASSATRADIQTILSRFSLESHFDFVASGDDVMRAKPFPDIYNLVRERLTGREYYVIEDSQNGVLAASRAGMTAIFFNPNGQPAIKFASFEISHLSELEGIIDGAL